MIIALLILILVVATMISSLYFIIKTNQLYVTYKKVSKVQVSDKLLRLIDRADMTLERFLLMNFIILLTIIIVIVNNMLIFRRFEVQSFAVPYMMLTLFYLRIISKNNGYRVETKKDIEEIMRISYFLEKGGSEEKEVYRHLSEIISGPLNPHMCSMFSSYKIIKDQKSILEKMKTDFSDIPEVVTYTNISIQKIDTGTSERILKNQLKAIKKIKHENFKVKRHRNRLKLYLMSFLLAASYMSVAVYPLIKDTLNNISKILY